MDRARGPATQDVDSIAAGVPQPVRFGRSAAVIITFVVEEVLLAGHIHIPTLTAATLAVVIGGMGLNHSPSCRKSPGDLLLRRDLPSAGIEERVVVTCPGCGAEVPGYVDRRE